MGRYNASLFTFVDARIVPGYGTEGGGDGGASGGTQDSDVSIDKVKEIVNTTVNNAIANLRKSDLPKIIKDQVDPITTQLGSINEALSAIKGSQGSGSGAGGGSGSGQGSTGGTSSSSIPPDVNAAIQELKKSNDKLLKQVEQLDQAKKDADKKAEEAERRSAIRSAIATLPYATDTAAATAFTIVEPHVKRTDDGTYIGGDNLPLEAFVQDFLPKEHAYLLKPLGSGGSGAGTGGGNAGGKGRPAATTEMIKPGMKPEERDTIHQAISNVLMANQR